jgi:ABC-2 type transport system ATP-binding protein
LPAAGPAAPVVEIQNLVKHYGRVQAVRGIDLEIKPGEVFGFLGPNGAGKTTTLRCLLGMLRPTAGRISLFGLDATSDGVRARRRVAYVPGELRLPDRVTGAELVHTIGRLRGGFRAGGPEQIAERLEFDLKRHVRDLSTGNRRKLALLLAFSADSDLLVLDEPTNGLDPLMQREFLRLVGEARQRGTSVLLSSHVLGEVQRIADRVALLRDGRIIASGTVDEIRRGARQRVEVWFATPQAAAEASTAAAAAGLRDVEIDERRLSATIVGPVQPLIEVLARQQVESLLVDEPNLEDAFLDLYEGAA